MSASGPSVPRALPGRLRAFALAYEEQCARDGGLSLPTAKRLADALREANADAAGDRRSRASLRPSRSVPRADRSSAAGHAPTRPAPLAYAIGTQFVREWRGVLHTVTSVSDGFAWNGSTYGSLSAVARAITGTRWNGRRFFGLGRDRNQERDGRAAKRRSGRGHAERRVAKEEVGP